MKILIIGGGNMGITYAKSFLKAHVTSVNDLLILEKSEGRAQFLTDKELGTVFRSPAECMEAADLVILAVKPQDADILFESIAPMVDPEQVFLSIMAGVRIETIRQALKVEKVIRAMPNLPAQIGMGMTAFHATKEVTRVELVTVQNLLNTTGKAIFLDNENLIDAATAISGSGPAYVYYFMNAMIEAAKDLGFSNSEAELLVGQTMMGSIHLQNRNNLTCQEWINQVSSKGGTTEAAINSFSQAEIHERIKKGAKAAHQRAVELGK